MVKTYKLVITWKIHGSVPFRLICILFFDSVAYEIINFWMDIMGFQKTILSWRLFDAILAPCK